MSLALLVALAAGAAGAHAQTLFATGVTSPGGGMVLSGTAIDARTGKIARHLWTSDQGGFGLCRIDPAIDVAGPHTLNGSTCVAFVDGVQFKPGQFAFDPFTNNVYAVDLQANSRGIFRLHYLPDANNGQGGMDPIHMEVLGGSNIATRNGLPGCGIAGNVPNSAVLGPDGNLYIGFKASGDILRVVAPQTEPLPCENVQVIGTTADTRKNFGLGFISHDLFGGDGLSAWVIPSADQCLTPQNGNTPCHGTNVLTAQTATPSFVMSDQMYPSVNGRNLFVGNPSDITLVDTANMQVTMRYAAGFQFLSGMALDPITMNLYVADDPTEGLLNAQGRWWFLGNKGGFVGPQTLVGFADGVTSPGGGVVLTGTGINPNTGKPYRHLWNGDQGGFGLCRLDPDIDSPGPHTMNAGTCLPFVAGVQFKPGQLAFDPILNNLYAVDMQANTKGIFRLHFLPEGDGGHGALDIIHQEVLAGNGGVGRNGLPGCGIAGNVPNSAVLGPDGNLYVGFKQSGDILRIIAPETEPLPCGNVVVMGSTPDNTRDMGLGWIGHDLFGGDGRAAFVIPNADVCMTPQNGLNPCHGNNILQASTVNPSFVMSDQMYPAVNGRNLLVGQPGSITLVNPASFQVTPGYVTGFQLLTAMTLDPSNLQLYVADDPSAGLLPQQGHWYQAAPLQVTPDVPGTPVGVFGTAGNASATLHWTPAPDGQTITSYIVRNTYITLGSFPIPDIVVNPTPGTTVVPTSINITGLTNGLSYEFEVAAVDAVGTSRFSVPSNMLSPFAPAPPKPPTHATAVGHDSSATVVFNGVPDYLNGGFPILVYKVEVQIEGVRTGQEILVNPLTNTALVTGLKNGTSYTFVVIATNQIGDSDPSLPSNSVTPVAVQTGITVPDAPTQVTASAGNASAVVSWKLPVSNGGSAITGFLVVPTANGIPSARGSVVPAPATSATIPGLINGATYTFTVQAINVMGASGLSAPSNAVMPAAAAQSTGVPSLPTGVSATAGVASATVTWTPPVNAGNSAISNYVVVAMSGGALTGNSVNVPAPATSVTINGLSAGTTYTFVVHAFNGTGDSGASIPSNAITPSAAAPPPASAPGVPTGVTAVAGNSSATVAWNAPASNGGSPIQSYNVVALSGGSPSGVSVTVTAPATAVQITKLTNGTAYTFVVHAINAAGDSGASAPSNTVTPGAPVPAPSGSANVGVTLTGPATVSAGTNAIFTITVTNSGAGTVPSVVLEDIFNLASGTLLSHVTSQGTCTDGTAVLDCKLGSLAAGASATIGFTLTVNTRITNKATVEALDSTGQRIPSSSPANSTASLITAVSASVSVAAAADLQISGTSTGTGAETTLVWLVSNTTNQIANAVRFTDQLPSALQLVSTMASAGVNCAAPASGSSGGLVTCSYHSLPGGQNMMVTITVTAAPSATPIATTASVDFNGTDSNPANNSFTLSVAAPLPPSPPPPATGGATGGGGAGGGGGVVVPGLNGGGGAGGHGGACVQPVLGGRGGAARGAGEIGGFLPGRCGGPGA